MNMLNKYSSVGDPKDRQLLFKADKIELVNPCNMFFKMKIRHQGLGQFLRRITF